MIHQIQIHPTPDAPQKEKGDFFEMLLRSIMETQRYKVTERINFTGTEIDLLCNHLDRPDDSALVECKARLTLAASDIKSFVYDIIVERRADHGFFVHTSELHHQVAGMVEGLKQQHPKELLFWGPDKVIELLLHCRLVEPPPETQWTSQLTPTKRVLLYTYLGRYWLTIFSNKIVPTHYHVVDATNSHAGLSEESVNFVANLDELQGLTRLETLRPTALTKAQQNFDSVAEVQEADQWDDYRPVGAKYFVGRTDARNSLYQFVQAPISQSSNRRVFFVEGKSGWGKSSLVAELRARSRNKRNKNLFFVLAVDSRSASTSEFVSLSIAKLIAKAAKAGFVSTAFSETNISSSSDTLASPQMQELLTWLQNNNRVLVIVFDQFEDVFRKEDLFRTFHKLMMDAHEQQGNFVVGFSWKSEIYIPIDNPAYGLWQQARDLAQTFFMEEFLGYEVDSVLRQLEALSGQQLPPDLRRRLRDLQRIPWLIKKLSIHCYHQLRKGITPEDLVDQNLNVDALFQDDTEGLSPEESRALNIIAKRGYDGDPFDVAEIDDVIQEAEINSLLGKRLIVRSGGKYNVYWDVFRDFLIEGRPPILAESFLLRQFPNRCVKMFEYLSKNAPCKVEELRKAADTTVPLKEGTTLNIVRELRYLGAVVKVKDEYSVRPSIHNIEEFHSYMRERLTSHVVVRELAKSTADAISHEDVIRALKENFKGYGFAQNTWVTYASYLSAWLRYAGIDFGKRLSDAPSRGAGSIGGFTPELRPDKDIETLLLIKQGAERTVSARALRKGLYDLKALGLVTYHGKHISLTKRGNTLLLMDDVIFSPKSSSFKMLGF